MKELKTTNNKVTDFSYVILRILTAFSVILLFFPGVNPARILTGTFGISKNLSLFTSAISYESLVKDVEFAVMRYDYPEYIMLILCIASIVLLAGIAFSVAGCCFSLGNIKCKKTGSKLSLVGGILMVIGVAGIVVSYILTKDFDFASVGASKFALNFPTGIIVFGVLAVVALLLSLVVTIAYAKQQAEEHYWMESKYKLFLMFLPFILLIFIFSYLPLYGWRYSFYEYYPGGTLSKDNFVGFKWFTQLFENDATRRDVVRVLKNTLGMSTIGIATSWFAMAFAILLTEIKTGWFRRFVQIFTTIPNFISWVLVYALALAIFSSDGFINNFIKLAPDFFEKLGITAASEGYLGGDSHSWLKMWAWGTWKGIGWSAIIYIAGISGIDQQLYEAATVDGAGRFQKIRHITIPGLIPTYCVLLLMSIAGILSNGMDQYLVFSNPQNEKTLEVLDLYVYNLGIANGAQGTIPLSTVIGMTKSLISVVLLFLANTISKLVRGESIF